MLLRTLEWVQRSNSCIEKTQESSIESSLQSSLPYILIHMVCMSRLQKVDFVSFYLFLIFIFIFYLFLIFLFLEL